MITLNPPKCKHVDISHAPNEQELENLGAGCFVQVHYGENYDWVEVIGVENEVLTGVLRCELDGSVCEVKDDKNKKEIKFKKNQIVNLGCDNYCWC